MVKCLDCNKDYDSEMSLDLVIPRDQWLLIHPDDGGVLCANCLISRASKLKNVINLTALITFADDYGGDLTPYHLISQMTKNPIR